MSNTPQLRRGGPWQIAMAHPPGLMALDVKFAGLVLVVDAQTGMVRAAEPLASLDGLTAAVTKAATKPIDTEAPMLPSALHCHPDIAGLLAAAAAVLGCKVVPTHELLDADHALKELLAFISPTVSWLPRTDLPWSQLLRDSIVQAPWRELPDSVLFCLSSDDPTLDGRVVIVLGMAGEQFGFSIFPSLPDFADFLAVVMAPPPTGQGIAFNCLAAHFEPLADHDPEQVDAAKAGGWVAGGLVLTLIDYEDGQPNPMTPDVEMVTVQAVQAVLATWRAHGRALAAVSTEHNVVVQGGVHVKVQAVPELADAPHVFVQRPLGLLDAHPRLFGWEPDGMFGETVPMLLFKYAKADAIRTSIALSGLDRIHVVPVGRWLLIEGWAGATHLGLLTSLAGDLYRRSVLTGAPRLRLCVAKGGARRRSYRKSDFVLDVSVPSQGDTVDPG